MNVNWKKICIASCIVNAVFIAVAIAVFTRGFYRRIATPYLRGYYASKAGHYRGMAVTPGAVIFVGDSQTDRCEWAEFLRRGDVLNRGIEADTTEGILARLDEVIRHRPSRVFLMAGGGDLMFRRGPAAIERDYRTILNRILASSPGTVIYAHSVLPTVFREVRFPRAQILEVNRRIRAMADGRRVIYVDLHGAMADTNGDLDGSYTDDGVHLNARGYAVWRRRIMHCLEGHRDFP